MDEDMVTQTDAMLPLDVVIIDNALSTTELDTCVVELKALAHPVRLRMVDLIHQGGGDICVCEFEKHFELSQPTISHHLKILREAGIIRSRQEGTEVRHRIDPETFSSITRLLNTFAEPQEAAN